MQLRKGIYAPFSNESKKYPVRNSRVFYYIFVTLHYSPDHNVSPAVSEVHKNSPRVKELYYSDPQMEILETTCDRVLFLAGVGSGKSQVIGVLSYEFVINNPEVRGFIGANTYSQLAKSTLDRVLNVWEVQFGLKENIHFVIDKIPPPHYKKFGAALKSYENTISFENGALIFLASLDNYKVIDGTEFGWACLDETKDTKEEAVKEVIVARLRQKGMCINPKTNVISKTMKPGYIGYNPLFIFTSPAKSKWLIEWFDLVEHAEEIMSRIISKTDYYRKKTGRKFVVISSSWHNAHNLPIGYIEGLEKDYAHNEGLSEMMIYGSPFGKTGGEFITTFSRLKHVKDFGGPWQDETVHLSFDFNYVPYMTCTCWQIKYIESTKRYLVRCFDEFCLPNPNNNCESLSKAIELKYGHLMKKGIFYYGDYSGKNGSTLVKEFKNNYEVIEKYLRPYINNSSDRVIVNQSLPKRRHFVNNGFAGAFPLDIEIHTQCKELQNDLEFLKEGPDGGKLKLKIKVNDITFEERGHTCDSLEYFLTSSFNNLFNM